MAPEAEAEMLLNCSRPARSCPNILAEGAIALPMTLSGNVLLAIYKLFLFLSNFIVNVILAILMGASAQPPADWTLHAHIIFCRCKRPTLRGK